MSNARLTPRPIFWPVLLVPAAVQFVLHVLTNGSYGIFRDEYYYLACAERLAWGYVDQPPLSIWILAGWTAIFGDSIHAIRILPAVCGAALVVLSGAIAARLGGGRWAQAFAAVGSAIGAAGLVIAGFYSMNCFDLVLWAVAFYLLVVIAGTGDGRWWPWFGLVVGLGLFNKIGLAVLGMAVVAGLLLTEHRRQLADWRLYAGGALAAAFLAPYVLWNMASGWPTGEFISNAKQLKIVQAKESLKLVPPKKTAILVPRLFELEELSPIQKRLLELLRRFGTLPIQAVQEDYKLTRSAARRELGELIKLKLVQAVRDGRGQAFRLA